MSIVAKSAVDITADGKVHYMKYADDLHVPASTMKTLAIYTARTVVTDALLDDTVTVVADDLVGGSSAHLEEGDVLTWNDLFHGMMLPSGNDAATCAARSAGALLPGAGDPYEKFMARMNEVCAQFGWVGAHAASPSGLDLESRLSPRHLCELAFMQDAYTVGVMGTLSYTGTITGPNPRSITWHHTTDPDGAVKFPEMVAAKGGAMASIESVSLVMLWDDETDTRHALALMYSWPSSVRYEDARTIIDSTDLPAQEHEVYVQIGGAARLVTQIRQHVGGATRDIQGFGLGA